MVCVPTFLEHSTRQAILGHPLWRGISAEEADYTAQALEAVVYTKIYKRCPPVH
jgi:hypothetical protein